MSDGEEHDDPLEEEDEYSPELPRKQRLRVDDDDDSSENAEWEPDYENAIRDAIKHKDVEVFKAIHGRRAPGIQSFAREFNETWTDESFCKVCHKTKSPAEGTRQFHRGCDDTCLKAFSACEHPEAHPEFRAALEKRKDAYHSAISKIQRGIKEFRELQRGAKEKAEEAKKNKKVENRARAAFNIDLTGETIAQQVAKLSKSRNSCCVNSALSRSRDGSIVKKFQRSGVRAGT